MPSVKIEPKKCCLLQHLNISKLLPCFQKWNTTKILKEKKWLNIQSILRKNKRPKLKTLTTYRVIEVLRRIEMLSILVPGSFFMDFYASGRILHKRSLSFDN